MEAENLVFQGTGSQTGSLHRWGDYSGMTVDPVDDCTFWYTTEYYSVTGANWQTRIGSIRYPDCGPTNSVHFLYLPAVLNPAAAPTGWTNIMQEGFEGTWPSAGWAVGDNGSGTNQLWAKRSCQPNTGSFSAWAIGGGSVGSGLACGASYPDNAQSWMIYGAVSLAGATAAPVNFPFVV